MPAQLPDVDWIDGDSAFLWIALLVAFYVGLVAFQVVMNALALSLGLPYWKVLLIYIVFGAVWFWLLLWFVLKVPRPVRLGIAAPGLLVDVGVRRVFFPWNRVRLADGAVICYSRWLRWPSRFALTIAQRERLEFIPPMRTIQVRGSTYP